LEGEKQITVSGAAQVSAVAPLAMGALIVLDRVSSLRRQDAGYQMVAARRATFLACAQGWQVERAARPESHPRAGGVAWRGVDPVPRQAAPAPSRLEHDT
jgi:hypothetical protein